MSTHAPGGDPEKSSSPQEALVPPLESHHDRVFDLEGGTSAGSSGPQPSAIVSHPNRKSTAPFGISGVVSEAQRAFTGVQPDLRTPKQKLQSAVRKISHVNRAVSYTKMWARTTREPGIDPRYVDLVDLKTQCVVQVVDLNQDDARFSVHSNKDIPAFLAKPRADWVKVRWIHVNGLSWDVLKPTALKYNLHPLALEDMLHHGTASTKSKINYYADQLFVSVVVHKTLASDRENASIPAGDTSDVKAAEAGKPFDGWSHDPESFLESKGDFLDERSTSSTIAADQPRRDPSSRSSSSGGGLISSHESYLIKLREAFSGIEAPDESFKRTLSSNAHGLMSKDKSSLDSEGTGMASKDAARQAARHVVTSQTKDYSIHVHIEQLSIFVLRNGTIISFTQDPGYHKRFSTVMDRTRSPTDIIRSSADSSFVLQGLLDVVSDHALEIVDEITEVEARVLVQPRMKDVKRLHVLSAQVILLKTTISPFQQILQGIRHHDDLKAAAACHAADQPADGKSLGFVSLHAKIYIEDVLEHVESVMTSLDLFSDLAENLIAYTFNTISYSSNSYMQGLSVLSVIFLPLTFLSGYFGMNFTTFPSVVTPDGNVLLFWKIAVPITVVSAGMFSWMYLLELYFFYLRWFTRSQRYLSARTKVWKEQ